VIWPRAVAFVNARVVCPEGEAEAVRLSSHILSIGEPPRRGDAVVDLEGGFVFPGLVNAHDHLELNHYGRLKGRDRYENASQWFDDMRPRLTSDEQIRAARAYPLVDRVFIGALKNLLAGVTLVAHHNPFYRELRRAMPIRILRRYGWAHSFLLERQPAGARGEPGGRVAERWRATPSSLPFFVHLGEGVDAAAAAELSRLAELGCLAANTVLVHGVAIDREGWQRVAAAGASLVWCPASNDFLFGTSVDVRGVAGDGCVSARIALGTDSRISGARDLLDEMRAARAAVGVSPRDLLAMATRHGADVIRQPRAGRIAVGLPSDIVVLPARAGDAAEALVEATRRDIQLVMVGGRPLVADRRMRRVFDARLVATRSLCVDAAAKIADASLVRRIAVAPIREPGVAAG
jgi:cytosine/adenosine deaminase-related metal-dependent hydrolase